MSSATEKVPLISVIIPAYNHEKFIGAAIESVLNQTEDDFELIVIDDGSTDTTGEVVQSYNDSRLRYYHQENQDAYNTINRGLGLATGSYISILNSDDVYTLDRFEKLLGHCKNSGAECVISDVIPISDSGEVFDDPEFGWNIWHAGNRDFYFKVEDIYTAFLKGNFMVTTSNLFMSSKAAQRVGKFCSLRYLHDYDFIFRMMLAFPGGVDYLADEKLLYYRIHSGNTLGEAAVVGREQDQQLISQYMAAVVSESERKRIIAGAERLVELGEELHEVRTVLNPDQPVGVRPAFKTLVGSLKTWAKKKIGTTS
ncbi:MAG: glycosyltransferase [Desulfobulbaceae bacterium]|nr:glycosyltransferase [Desulfobulbaceae bacterium]